MKNAEVKLKAQRQSEKIKALNARRKGLAFKDTHDSSSSKKSESQADDMRMSVLVRRQLKSGKKDCPLFKDKFKKMKMKKVLYVGWEESEPSDSDEEQHEISNLRMVNRNKIYFVAHENVVVFNSEDPFTLDELEDSYIELEKRFQEIE